MSYRTERSVLLDQKMIIKGVQYHEKKEVEMVFKKEDGEEICISQTASHMRSIGEKSNTARVTLPIFNFQTDTNMTKVWIL